jgi:hypothetical protein
VRPIDNRGYQYDKKWAINDKQNVVMNGNKIGVLGGINIIFLVIKLPFWANAIRPYDILQVTSLCAKKEVPTPKAPLSDNETPQLHGSCAYLLLSKNSLLSKKRFSLL